jgi:hypothetical protein
VDDEWVDVQDEILDPEVNDTGKKRKVSILNTQPKKRQDKKKKKVSFGIPCIRIFGEPDAKPDAEPEEEWIRVWTLEEMEEIKRNMAATMIQKIYRGYRMRVVTRACARINARLRLRQARPTEVESGNGQM